MKIIQSKGRSYTEQQKIEEETTLIRKIRLNKLGSNNDEGDIVKLLSSDPHTIIRFMASALDKTYLKMRNHGKYTKDTYIHRTEVAKELWSLFKKNSENKEVSRDIWEQKIHPYSIKDGFDWDHPAEDKNSKKIEECRTKIDELARKPQSSDFYGSWYQAFTSGIEDTDYKKIAERIWNHIDKKELKIDGKEASYKIFEGSVDKESRGGLLAVRSNIITQSVNDPRKIKDKNLSLQSIPENILDSYLARSGDQNNDLAKKLLEESLEQIKDDPKAIKPRLSAVFGEVLYNHLGSLKDEYGAKTPKELWKLHNRVRKIYSDLAKSQKLRIAIRQGDEQLIKFIFPNNNDDLKKLLANKDINQDVNQLIRLGKMVVHAGSIEASDNQEQDFKNKLDYYATSQGQIDIKAKETFVRFWRTATALSLRSLRGFVNNNENIKPEDDDPIGGEKESFKFVEDTIKTARNLKNKNYYENQLHILFGKKEFSLNSEEQTSHQEVKISRSAIFSNHIENKQGKSAAKEIDYYEAQKRIIWSLLRITAYIRNNVHHFSSIDVMIKKIEEGVITKIGKKVEKNNFSDSHNKIKANEYFSIAAQNFNKLFAFDHWLEVKVLENELEKIKAHSFFTNEDQAKKFIDEITANNDDQDILCPRFMPVLTRLVKSIDANHDHTKNFSVISLLQNEQNNLILEEQSVAGSADMFKVGILRLLYNSGFRSWLKGLEADKQTFLDILDATRKQKEENKRKHAEDKNIVLNLEDSKILSLANKDRVKNVQDLVEEITAAIAQEERDRYNYQVDDAKQRHKSNSIENFKRDFFAFAFAKYLQKESLGETLFSINKKQKTNIEICVPNSVKLEQQYSDTMDWQTQFYIWLYLIPTDHVNRLLNQVRKTRILANKKRKNDSEEKSFQHEPPLKEIEKLMERYIKVNDMGFDGTEEITEENILQALFVDDKNAKTRIFSNDEETHDESYPRIRRGLRQIQRFGHLEVLRDVFASHKIDKKITDYFNTDKNRELENKHTGQKLKFLQQIQESDNERDRNIAADSYMCSSTLSLMHDFKIRTARMEDHTRAHRIMTRVIARLMDFAVTWERDRLFMLVGIIYLKYTNGGANPDNVKWVFNSDKKAKVLRINDSTEIILWSKNPRDSESQYEKIINQSILTASPQEKLWAKQYKKAFIGGEKERPKQVRNSFSHFNPISAGNKGFNLTTSINQIRELISYDRKLKNDVVRAVKNVLLDENINISWQINNYKLEKPLITPVIHKPLKKFSQIKKGKQEFALPSISPLLVSMVKAMFDDNIKGYKAKDHSYKKKLEKNIRSVISKRQNASTKTYLRLFSWYMGLINDQLSDTKYYDQEIKKQDSNNAGLKRKNNGKNNRSNASRS